jgi:phospholipase/lecithinase/hemolysin
MGNVASSSFDLFPGPAYYNDRFSNGPVWVESLSIDLGFGALTRSTANGDNFAYGGAKTTGTGGIEGFFIRDIDEQVTQFISNRTVDPAALFVVFAGSNDLIQGQTNVNVPVNRLATDIGRLIAAGARSFLVPNLPLLGYTPRFNGAPATAAQYNLRTSQFNAALNASLNGLEAGNVDVEFHRLDVADLFADAIAHPTEFGLTNVTASAAPGLEPGDGSYDTGQIVPNSNQYLFWDDLHPTAAMHGLLAERANALVNGAPGDFNADARVDGEDLAAWAANFGSNSATRSLGDANGDRVVDGADFLAWQRNLSVGLMDMSVGLMDMVVSVPESATGVMFAIGLAILLVGHQRVLGRRLDGQSIIS